MMMFKVKKLFRFSYDVNIQKIDAFCIRETKEENLKDLPKKEVFRNKMPMGEKPKRII